MSANDHLNFPPGTHMLDASMSLIPSHAHSNSNFDTGDGTADGKDGVILNPTPSNDPDDPLVSSPSRVWTTILKGITN